MLLTMHAYCLTVMTRQSVVFAEWLTDTVVCLVAAGQVDRASLMKASTTTMPAADCYAVRSHGIESGGVLAERCWSRRDRQNQRRTCPMMTMTTCHWLPQPLPHSAARKNHRASKTCRACAALAVSPLTFFSSSYSPSPPLQPLSTPANPTLHSFPAPECRVCSLLAYR
jgi:hypothetical protein